MCVRLTQNLNLGVGFPSFFLLWLRQNSHLQSQEKSCCCWSNLTSGSQKWYRQNKFPCQEKRWLQCHLYKQNRSCSAHTSRTSWLKSIIFIQAEQIMAGASYKQQQITTAVIIHAGRQTKLSKSFLEWTFSLYSKFSFFGVGWGLSNATEWRLII